MIEWTQAMSVGCEALDADHRRLVDILNRYVVAMDDDEGVFVIDPIFRELIDYTETHFVREEAVMAACGYPELDAHKDIHGELETRLFDMRQRYMQTPSDGVAREIHDFLDHWLQQHILLEDMDYKESLKGHEAAIEKALAAL